MSLRARPLLAIVVSRVAVGVAALLAENLPGRNPGLTSGGGGPLITSLTSWDGWWFVQVARTGYHATPLVGGYHDYAFLPLYPALVALLASLTPAYTGLAAVVVANVSFAIALVLLVTLGREVLGDDRAERGVALLALSPFSGVFSMAYSESLFLMLSVGAFLAAERDRRPLSGILLAAAALTRLQGAVLVLPLWVLYVRRDRRLRPSQAWLLAGPVAALGFLAFVALLTSDPGSYGGAQAAWGRIGPSASPAGGSILSALSTYQLVLVVTLSIAVFLLVYLRPDRLPAAYAAVPVAYIGLELGSGLLEAVGRIVTTAFPYGWLLAGRRARWFRRGWPPLSLLLLFVVSLAMFRGYFVP